MLRIGFLLFVTTGEGLYGYVKKSLTHMGVEWSKMVGLGCDGTNDNIGRGSDESPMEPERNGMKWGRHSLIYNPKYIHFVLLPCT